MGDKELGLKINVRQRSSVGVIGNVRNALISHKSCL